MNDSLAACQERFALYWGQKPNIIYIFADDLGIGDLSCYGATKVSTPNKMCIRDSSLPSDIVRDIVPYKDKLVVATQNGVCLFNPATGTCLLYTSGIPIQLLSNRPDVKAAEMTLASAYYNTNSARSAFYPQITLSEMCIRDRHFINA